MDNRFEYRYVPSIMKMLFGILFFGACAAFFGNEALSGGRSVSIFHLVELNYVSAQIFHLVMFILSLAFVMAGILALSFRGKGDPNIVLTDETLTIPRPMYKTSLEIGIDRITGISETKIAGTKSVGIKYAKGERSASILVVRGSFQNKAAFADFMRRLAEAIRRRKTGRLHPWGSLRQP